MNREEKLILAEKCRKAGAFGLPDPEILENLAVKPERKMIEANQRGVDTYIFDPADRKENSPMFINLHGGGFIKGRADRDSVYCSYIADTFKALVYDVDYVLAPEYPYPAAVNESYDIVKYVYEHAAELKIDRERIFILGHSAGSNLACGALIQNYYNPAFRVRGVLMDYIPADQRQNAFMKIRPEDYNDERRVSRAIMENNYLELYMEPAQCIEELASPVLASDEVLASFPDACVITAGLDSLLEEGEVMANRLAKAGCAVTWRRFRNSPHGFTINRNGEWEEALLLHERFIKGLL